MGDPFTLLQRGDGQGVENVVHGTWHEVAVIAFDYWYYDESTNGNGMTSRSYHRFNSVLLPIDADCLVDARMMAWLSATGYGHAYEVVGNRVLVAGPRIDPVELTSLLGVARGSVQHVPKVVASLYPG